MDVLDRECCGVVYTCDIHRYIVSDPFDASETRNHCCFQYSNIRLHECVCKGKAGGGFRGYCSVSITPGINLNIEYELILYRFAAVQVVFVATERIVSGN